MIVPALKLRRRNGSAGAPTKEVIRQSRVIGIPLYRKMIPVTLDLRILLQTFGVVLSGRGAN